MERWCNEADIKWAVERELKKGTQVRNEEMCRERSAAAFGPAAGAGSGQRPGSAEPVPRPRGPPTLCGGLPGLPWRFRPRRGRRAATKRGPPAPSRRPADGERGPGPTEALRASPALHPARGEGERGIARGTSLSQSFAKNGLQQKQRQAVLPSPTTSFLRARRWFCWRTAPGGHRTSPSSMLHGGDSKTWSFCIGGGWRFTSKSQQVCPSHPSMNLQPVVTSAPPDVRVTRLREGPWLSNACVCQSNGGWAAGL